MQYIALKTWKIQNFFLIVTKSYISIYHKLILICVLQMLTLNFVMFKSKKKIVFLIMLFQNKIT